MTAVLKEEEEDDSSIIITIIYRVCALLFLPDKEEIEFEARSGGDSRRPEKGHQEPKKKSRGAEGL